jgi:hypothetical protein
MNNRRKNRIIYCGWLAENLRVDKDRHVDLIPEPVIDFESLESFDSDELERLALQRQGEEVAERITIAVREAMRRLTDDEREFLSRFYSMGQTYRELSEKSGRTVHSLEALHTRAKRRLRKLLTTFVKHEFGVEASRAQACPICASPERPQIDELLAAHLPEATWRRELQLLKSRFSLRRITPQTIIGHINYHS